MYIDTEAAPHRPVRLRVALTGRNVPQLVVGNVTALERIVGPSQQPTADAGRLVKDLEELSKAVRAAKSAGAIHARQLDQLCRAWYAEAFVELAAATGMPATEYEAPMIR